MAFYRALKQSLLHLAFPTKCLHCQVLLLSDSIVLCPGCASLFDLIPSEYRCPTCFIPLREESILCQECLRYPSLYAGMAAAFDYEGPPSSLVKRLKYANQPYLAKGMAAFLVGQFDRLQWPLPDALIPVPLSLTRRFERGYNQSHLLAEEMGKLLGRPVWNALKRQSGDFSQAALSLEQRKGLNSQRFKLKKGIEIAGKILLVIDDVMTSGSTLRACGELLGSGNPEALYALTFCRTVQ